MTEAIIAIEDVQSPSPDKIMKIVRITGQLDESNIDEKIQEVYKILETNPKNLNLIFDFENLEYMNSKSIGYITDIYGKVTESLGQVVIANARPNITDILQVVGLTQLIKLLSSTEEAKNYLAGSTASTTLATADQEPATPAIPTPVATQEVSAFVQPEPATTTEPQTVTTPMAPMETPSIVAEAAPTPTPAPEQQPVAPSTTETSGQATQPEFTPQAMPEQTPQPVQQTESIPMATQGIAPAAAPVETPAPTVNIEATQTPAVPAETAVNSIPTVSEQPVSTTEQPAVAPVQSQDPQQNEGNTFSLS